MPGLISSFSSRGLNTNFSDSLVGFDDECGAATEPRDSHGHGVTVGEPDAAEEKDAEAPKQGADAHLSVANDRVLAPDSLHQMATHYILTDGVGINGPVKWYWQYAYLILLVVLIAFQTMCAYGIFIGLVRGSCVDSDECSAGFWCDNTQHHRKAVLGNSRFYANCNRCNFNQLDVKNEVTKAECVEWFYEPGNMENETFALPPASRAFCDGCYDLVDRDFNMYQDVIKARIDSMQTLDWCVFILNAAVICISAAAEFQDIHLCRAMEVGYGNRDLHKHFGLWVINAMRMYMLIPIALTMPVAMVYTLGGTALDTTLNTLATLFLLEIDDIIYAGVIDVRYKRSVRRHGLFKMRSFDYCLVDTKRLLFIIVAVPLECVQVATSDPNFVKNAVGLFFLVCLCLGFLDAMRDPLEGRMIMSFIVRRLAPTNYCMDESTSPLQTRVTRRFISLVVLFLLSNIMRIFIIFGINKVSDFDIMSGYDDDSGGKFT
mmetsp:Transcript_34649/g.107142  ORF Transcript_34649/g.107142 Transcript_34649/m.107142 type:complete len:489 (+) Transcript_34649:195-1661(+)